MSVVSEIWTWHEGGRVYSRVTTNVHRARLLSRLTILELLPMVEVVHAYFDDRSHGGTGYEILWKCDVRLEDLERLVDL